MLMNRLSSVQYAATDYEAIIMEEKLYTQAEVDKIRDESYDEGYSDGHAEGYENGYDEGCLDMDRTYDVRND